MILEYLAGHITGMILGLILPKVFKKTTPKKEIRNDFDVDGIISQVESGQLKMSKPRDHLVFEVESSNLSVGITDRRGGFTQDGKDSNFNTYFKIKDGLTYCINLDKEQIDKLVSSLNKLKANKLDQALQSVASMSLESAVKRLDNK